MKRWLRINFSPSRLNLSFSLARILSVSANVSQAFSWGHFSVRGAQVTQLAGYREVSEPRPSVHTGLLTGRNLKTALTTSRWHLNRPSLYPGFTDLSLPSMRINLLPTYAYVRHEELSKLKYPKKKNYARFYSHKRYFRVQAWLLLPWATAVQRCTREEQINRAWGKTTVIRGTETSSLGMSGFFSLLMLSTI